MGELAQVVGAGGGLPSEAAQLEAALNLAWGQRVQELLQNPNPAPPRTRLPALPALEGDGDKEEEGGWGQGDGGVWGRGWGGDEGRRWLRCGRWWQVAHGSSALRVDL